MLIDPEEQLVFHLAIPESLDYIVREGVTAALLNRPQSRRMFQFASNHLNTSGTAPTEAVLKTEFPDQEFVAPESAIEWVVDKLRERFQKKAVEVLVEDLAKRHDDPDEAMRYLREQVMEIEKASLSTKTVWEPASYQTFLHDWQNEIMDGMHQGFSLGFSDIDQFTGGLKAGGIGYILARPKRKKTWKVLNAFLEQAKHDNKPYLHTLELTPSDIIKRLSCMLSGVSWDKAWRGNLMPDDWKKMETAWKQFSDQHTFWIESPGLDERTVPALLLKADKVGAESILISQFTYVRGLKDHYRSPHEENAEVAVALKQAAAKPGAERPILVEAQFNRGGDSMDDLKDFSGSKVGLTDMIPQTADILLGIVETEDLRQNKLTEFGILDSRSTDKASWYVQYEFRTETKLNILPGSQH